MSKRTWVIPDNLPDRAMCAGAVFKAIGEAKAGWEVVIRAPDKSRSQRGLFHITCEEIGKAMGETPAAIKQFVKIYHYGYDERRVGRKWYRILRSTEEDNKEQYTALIEAAFRWAAENEVVVE